MSDEKRTFYEIVRDCCSESTTHGIPYLFKRNQISLKLFWLVCTLASGGVCGWLVSSSILDYYSYDTITQTKVEFETPTYFPAVSICSLNAFTTEQGYEFARNCTKNAGIRDIDQNLKLYFPNDLEYIR